MGWGRMLLLGNWGQQMDIEDQRRELQKLRYDLVRSRSAEDGGRLAALEQDIAELRMYLAALIRYLVSKGAVDANEFRVLVEEIDREDGRQNGGFRGKMP